MAPTPLNVAHAEGCLGHAYAEKGDPTKAIPLLETTVARFLGRIARTMGDLSDAESHLEEALRTFTEIAARFEVGRTHLDMAGLSQMQGDTEEATMHLDAAYRVFRALRVPRYAEKAERLADVWGVRLAEYRRPAPSRRKENPS